MLIPGWHRGSNFWASVLHWRIAFAHDSAAIPPENVDSLFGPYEQSVILEEKTADQHDEAERDVVLNYGQ